MHKACIFAYKFSQMGEEGDDVMLNFALNLVDFSD